MRSGSDASPIWTATARARDSAVDDRLAALESTCSDLDTLRLTHTNDERDSRVTTLEVAATDLSTWRPEVEALVDDLKLEPRGEADFRQLGPSTGDSLSR